MSLPKALNTYITVWKILLVRAGGLRLCSREMSLAELAMDVVPPIVQRKILEALESLEWRSLIERHSVGFTLKPMLMSFMKERLKDQADEEDINQSLKTSLKRFLPI